jgi:hypothetical protein
MRRTKSRTVQVRRDVNILCSPLTRMGSTALSIIGDDWAMVQLSCAARFRGIG